MQCKSYTTAGVRCRNAALPGSEYCGITSHNPIPAPLTGRVRDEGLGWRWIAGAIVFAALIIGGSILLFGALGDEETGTTNVVVEDDRPSCSYSCRPDEADVTNQQVLVVTNVDVDVNGGGDGHTHTTYSSPPTTNGGGGTTTPTTTGTTVPGSTSTSPSTTAPVTPTTQATVTTCGPSDDNQACHQQNPGA